MFGVHFHLNLFIIIVNLFCSACSEIPRTVLCADPECKEVISEAQGTILYYPNEEHVLGFKKGAKIMIHSKTKEKNGYWGAKIENRFGFVPSAIIKEYKVWKGMDMLQFSVPTSTFLGHSVKKENNNLNQENSIVKGEKESEEQISYTFHGSPVSLQENNILGNTTNVASELLNKTQNPQESVLQENNTVSNFPQVDAAFKIQSNSVTKFDTEERNESGEKVADESIPQTVTHSNNGEKKGDVISGESTDTNIKKTTEVTTSEGQSAEEINQEKFNLSEKIGTEPEIMTDVNTNLDSNQKNDMENSAETAKVDVNENDNNHSIDSSNKFHRSVSDNDILDSSKLGTKDPDKNIIIPEKIDGDSLSETTLNITEVPLIVEGNDPSFIPEEGSTTESKNKPTANTDVNFQNILPSVNKGISDGSQFKTDSGMVNESSSKNAMNEEINDTLAYNYTANADVFVSSDDSNSISSDSSVDSNIPATHISDNGLNAPSNDNLKHSGLPSYELQKEDNTPNIAEVVNKSEAQYAHIPIQKTWQNDINSADKLDPSSVYVSLGHAPPYNLVKQREKYNTESTPPPPANIEASKTVGVSPSIAINNENNRVLHEQFAPPASEPLQVQSGGYQGNQEGIHENAEAVSSGEQRQESGQVGSSDHETTTSQEQSGNAEKPPTGNAVVPSLGNVEGEVRDQFHDEIQMQSSAEVVPESIYTTENSNIEVSTPDSPLSVVTDGYQNAKEKTTEDIGIGEVTSENNGNTGFISNSWETLLGWVGLRSKKQEREPDMQEKNHFGEIVFHSSELQPSEFYVSEKVAPEETCEVSDGTTVNCNDLSSDENNSLWSFWLDNKALASTSSYNTFIYLVVTAVTVLLFTLGYYFIEKFRNDRPLIAKVNRLEQELLVSSKECLILKDELANTKEKLNLFETSSNDKIITSLQQELEEGKKIRTELETNIEMLQQELDAATEAGLDLNRMLSEVLTQKGGSETLMESVEHLQAQLNNQQKIIDEMTSKLFTKTNENQELRDELTAANEKIENLESEIEDLRGNLNVHLKDNEDIIKELTSKNNELQAKMIQVNDSKEKELGKMKKNLAELEKKLKMTADCLRIKEEECTNLKDSVKKMKVKDGKNIDSLFESSRLKAELSQATSENSSLKDRLKAEEDKYAKLDIKVKKLEEEVQKLKHISIEAEKEKTEAQTRLEVLSNYFKEKETQLQKELGLREAMWVQKQGDDSTIYEKMKSLEEEINSYKSQNEALKKEILDQERGLKAQITTLEKKAHENWIAARQAERKLDESKQEASKLRNKMTLMEKNISNDLESSHRVNDELNGGDALSPLIHDNSPILFPPPLPLDPNNSSLMPPGFIPPPMFMPPPPGGFMPPPPPFLPGDHHRPPPLGRMSSPPLNNRFSPPPPDYAYDRMSTPPLSPSNRNYRSPSEADRDRERFRHRTPTSPSFRSRNWEESTSVGMSGFRPITSERDSRREHKGGSNLSSGHSSDSLDKSSRHSSRV